MMGKYLLAQMNSSLSSMEREWSKQSAWVASETRPLSMEVLEDSLSIPGIHRKADWEVTGERVSLWKGMVAVLEWFYSSGAGHAWEHGSVGCLCPYLGHFLVDFKNSTTILESTILMNPVTSQLARQKICSPQSLIENMLRARPGVAHVRSRESEVFWTMD